MSCSCKKPCSCECHNNPKKTPKCFWFTQGQCFIDKMPPYQDIEIIYSNPQAALDVLCCQEDCYVTEDQVEAAIRSRNYKTEQQVMAIMQTELNRYVDRHRIIGQSSVFRTPRGTVLQEDGSLKKEGEE